MPRDLGLSYCADQVRAGDHDHFLTALFAPSGQREHLYGLFAFNLELARIADSVREPMLGTIRLQWWREAIEDIRRGVVRRHPVVEAVARTIDRMPCALTDQMIDARALDLSEEPPASLDELVQYAAETGGATTELAAHILSPEQSVDQCALAACRNVGVAWTLIGIVRSIPFHASRGRVLLPNDLLVKEGASVRDILEGRSSPELRRVVCRIVEEAVQRLGMARGECRRGRISRAVLPALLPAALADLYIRALRRSGYDPFQAVRRPSVPRLQMRLLRKAVIGRF
jgi:phytoene synthase